MNRRAICGGSLAVAAVLCPTPALAHLVSARFGTFHAGVLHPITALEHLLPWLTLGLLAGLQDGERARWVLLAFPLGLIAGVGLSLPPFGGGPLPGLDVLSLTVLGVAVALAWRLPTPGLASLGTVLGLIHGYQNGPALADQGNVGLFVAGVATAGLVVVTLVAACAKTMSQKGAWGRVAVRAAGSWMAAVGLMMIGLQVLPR